MGLDRQTGALYDVLPVDGNKHLNPVGEYNRSKIVVDGNHIEHWLNGYRVLEFELGSEKLTQGIATSKFKRVEGLEPSIRIIFCCRTIRTKSPIKTFASASLTSVSERRSERSGRHVEGSSIAGVDKEKPV